MDLASLSDVSEEPERENSEERNRIDGGAKPVNDVVRTACLTWIDNASGLWYGQLDVSLHHACQPRRAFPARQCGCLRQAPLSNR